MAVDHNELAARVGDLLQRRLSPARACAMLKDRANGASTNDMQLAMWIALHDQAEQIAELEAENDEVRHQEHVVEDLSAENERLLRENNKLQATLDEFLRCYDGKAAP